MDDHRCIQGPLGKELTEQAPTTDPIDISQGRPCRRCGMWIVFVRGPKGRDIPVQKIRTVYRVTVDLAGTPVLEKPRFGGSNSWISHMETCPAANAFNRKNRG